jgi:maleylpyruvate isomerase
VRVSSPASDIARVADAHWRFLGVIRELTDEDVRRATPLPGWTVGHVVTHLARNADSHVRRAHAAARGQVVDQYPGGRAGREAEIEAGAVRPSEVLVEDFRVTAQTLEAVWADTPRNAWERITRDVGGRERPLHELPSRRWQELEVHLVDLEIGITHRDWSDEFVGEWLPRTRNQMSAKMPAGSTNLRFEVPADELAWLYGRLRRSDLPEPPSWG